MTHPVDRLVREIPDFPKAGIRFKDLTPLFGDGPALEHAMADLDAEIDWTGVTRIAAIEARGFVIGGYLAARRRMGFIPIRKPGKLPARTITETYELEYGRDTLEMHADACEGGSGVLIVDDVLATGGTASAAARLVERAGGEVKGFAFLLELSFLSGRDRLPDRPLWTLLTAED